MKKGHRLGTFVGSFQVSQRTYGVVEFKDGTRKIFNMPEGVRLDVGERLESWSEPKPAGQSSSKRLQPKITARINPENGRAIITIAPPTQLGEREHIAIGRALERAVSSARVQTKNRKSGSNGGKERAFRAREKGAKADEKIRAEYERYMQTYPDSSQRSAALNVGRRLDMKTETIRTRLKKMGL